MMTAKEIRNSFLEFFRSKKHRIVPSSPVVPQDDPTLLFINAGMNQFKDVFLGTGKRDYTRVADSQKCIRVSGKHNDLEQVGRDGYHHTFFEMLGNWSFGDYYKKEAIAWAWELLTQVWQLPKDKLYATVFRDDDEAAELWPQVTDIDPSHILRFHEKDNFWEMGDTGPCGPCSEIHIDRGPGYCDSTDPNHVCSVNQGCARYIELWNLVFIQFNRNDSGGLEPLPSRHVDTGAGFERLVSVMQNKRTNYDTDIFLPILQRIQEITGKSYTDVGETGVAFRVLADHIRTLSFAIADGAIPANEGRGYVLRRILRRAARFGRVLGMREPFFYQLVTPLVDSMGEAYPELVARHQHISRVIRAEEENFGKTLDRGIEIFEEKAAKGSQNGNKIFSGSDAFLLHDTYGFPLDLTQLMAEEKGLSVDVAAFQAEMEQQKERSRVASAFATSTTLADFNVGSLAATEFIGYSVDQTATEVMAYSDGKMILQKTPFYAESGGQIGDSGIIAGPDFEFQVADTRKMGDHYLHIGMLKRGQAPAPGLKVQAIINSDLRRATERNHTATHLLHKALRTVLGEHVQQAGSLVRPDYLRFDFTHFEKVGPEDLRKIEMLVNDSIMRNYSVEWQILSFDHAKARGAMALFGEKYGETVRMIEVDNYSRELCGGTHVRGTGEIGLFIITGESAVAAGIRRIEAVTGLASLHLYHIKNNALLQLAHTLACPPDDLGTRVEAILTERRSLEQEVRHLKQHTSKSEIAQLIKTAHTLKDFKVVAARVVSSNVDDLRDMADALREQLKSGVGVLGTVFENKVSLVCVVTQDLIDGRKLNAGQIVRQVAQVAGGSGGGKPHMALAGAREPEKLELALFQVPEIIGRMLAEAARS